MNIHTSRVSTLFFVVLLVGGLFFSLHPAGVVVSHATWSGGTIYIKSDGSVDPAGAPITTSDNVTYTVTDDILASSDGIVVQRSNIILDVAGHTIQGSSGYTGIIVELVDNVTIVNARIVGFREGIIVKSSSFDRIMNSMFISDGIGVHLDKGSSHVAVVNNTFQESGLFVYRSYNNTVENNTVNGKPLVYLEGASHVTVSDAGQVVLVKCTDIRVEGLNLSKASVGVELWMTNMTIIRGNIISGNNRYGVYAYYTHGNYIEGNIITGNGDDGISLYDSRDTVILDNTIAGNGYDGIYLSYSPGNYISGNNITGNSGDGLHLWKSYYNSILGNHISGNDRDGVYIGNSKDNRVKSNVIEGNGDYGVYLSYSSYNDILGNNISNNSDGLHLWRSSKNYIKYNNIMDNNRGIYLGQSDDNKIYHNNFIDNSQHTYIYDSASIWDGGYPYGGNYWSGYSDTDSYSGANQDQPGSDGIWDHPYVIDSNNTDRYPFTHPLRVGIVSVGGSLVEPPQATYKASIAAITALALIAASLVAWRRR